MRNWKCKIGIHDNIVYQIHYGIITVNNTQTTKIVRKTLKCKRCGKIRNI
jgi:hypothetical protein